MENQITIEQAIRMTVNMLNGIQVPVSMAKQIGVPVQNAIENLEACLNALDKAKEKQVETDEPAEE